MAKVRTCAWNRCGKELNARNPGVRYRRAGELRGQMVCQSHANETPNW